MKIILVIFVLSSTCLHLVNSCDVGWTTVGQRCFRLFTHEHNWIYAQTFCQSFGGSLASIQSESENAIVLSLRPLNGWHGWIGGLRSNPGNNFIWVDGNDWSYEKWESGQPDNFNEEEKCLEIKSDGWNDNNCHIEYGFVCAKTRYQKDL